MENTMHRHFRWRVLVAALIITVLSVAVSGCAGSEEADNLSDLSYDMLDLSTIADKIYEEADIDELTRQSVSVITDETVLTEQYYLDLGNITDYEVRSAEGKYGVADVVLLHVKSDTAEKAIESLELRKDDRIYEFSNYDVLDSYSIAMEADIYQADELVVMLMLPDESKTRAMEIIESFIPRKQ